MPFIAKKHDPVMIQLSKTPDGDIVEPRPSPGLADRSIVGIESQFEIQLTVIKFLSSEMQLFCFCLRGYSMNRPDLFLQGHQSFTDGIIDIATQTKRIADHFDVQQDGSKKPRTATRKVVYCTNDWDGKTHGPKYGRFFSEFPKSPEGKEAAEYKAGMEIVPLILTWLLKPTIGCPTRCFSHWPMHCVDCVDCRCGRTHTCR